MRYSPRNLPETTKTPSFGYVSIAMRRVHGGSKIDPGPQKSALYPTKLATNANRNEFLRRFDSRTQGSWSIRNPPRTPKQCAIAQETRPKRKNNELCRHLDSRAHGSWSIKNRPQKSALYPTKLARNAKRTSFCDVSIAMHSVHGA